MTPLSLSRFVAKQTKNTYKMVNYRTDQNQSPAEESGNNGDKIKITSFEFLDNTFGKEKEHQNPYNSLGHIAIPPLESMRSGDANK